MTTVTSTKKSADLAKVDPNASEKLAIDNLPEQYREEILRQYDLPKVKVNLFTLLGYGTWGEFALQILGSVMSVGAGRPYMRV